MNEYAVSFKDLKDPAKAGPWLKTHFFSHNPAYLDKQMIFHWKDPLDRDTPPAQFISEIDLIKKTHQLSIAVLAEYADAVFVLQEAHTTGAQVYLDIQIRNAFDSTTYLDEQEAKKFNEKPGFYPTRIVNFLAMFYYQGAKVASIIPHEGEGDYKSFYLVNFTDGEVSYTDESGISGKH